MPSQDERELKQLVQEIGRRGHRPRCPVPMGEVIAGLMARRGYGRIQGIAECEKAWREAAGPELSRHSRPGNLRRGILEVVVCNSAVLQELTFQKKRLLTAVNEAAPEQKIRDLRFRVGCIEGNP